MQNVDNQYCRISEHKIWKDQFVNIVKSHECNTPNLNSTTKTAGKAVEEFSQSSKNIDTKGKASSTQKED
jgi:hypothetical protein